MIYYFLLPPINALLLNLNEGLLEHLLTNVGVLGNVNPLSPLSSECLLPLNVDVLPSKWSPLGDDATIDVTPLLGVTLPGYDDGGIDGGGCGQPSSHVCQPLVSPACAIRRPAIWCRCAIRFSFSASA